MEADTLINTISILTFLSSIITMLSGLVPVYEAFQTRSVANYPFSFFLCYTFLTLLSLYYGYLLQDTLLIIINLISLLLSFVYLSSYVWLCSRRVSAMMTILVMLCAFAILNFVIQNMTEDPATLQSYVGLMSCTASTVQNTVPIGEVITSYKQRSSQAIVLSLLIATTNGAMLWLIYGMLLNNWFISFPNIPGLVVNAARFYILWKFPRAATMPHKKVTPDNTDQSEVEYL